MCHAGEWSAFWGEVVLLECGWPALMSLVYKAHWDVIDATLKQFRQVTFHSSSDMPQPVCPLKHLSLKFTAPITEAPYPYWVSTPAPIIIRHDLSLWTPTTTGNPPPSPITVNLHLFQWTITCIIHWILTSHCEHPPAFIKHYEPAPIIVNSLLYRTALVRQLWTCPYQCPTHHIIVNTYLHLAMWTPTTTYHWTCIYHYEHSLVPNTVITHVSISMNALPWLPCLSVWTPTWAYHCENLPCPTLPYTCLTQHLSHSYMSLL